jgi:hypothetical protein
MIANPILLPGILSGPGHIILARGSSRLRHPGSELRKSADGPVFVRVSNSVVVQSGQYAFSQNSASAFFGSMGNNFVAGSGTNDATGTITPLAAH